MVCVEGGFNNLIHCLKGFQKPSYNFGKWINNSFEILNSIYKVHISHAFNEANRVKDFAINKGFMDMNKWIGTSGILCQRILSPLWNMIRLMCEVFNPQ